MNNGFELRKSDKKGEGIFATKLFKPGETVMVGIIDKILKENDAHASQIGKNEFVLHEGLVNKVNHSCDPNCGIRLNNSGGHDYVAIREISINEEITFDYAMGNYRIEYFPKNCMCGAVKCRGTITGWKDLSIETKKVYENFAAPYLIKLDAVG